MNKILLLTLVTAIGIVAVTTTVVAAPLPYGTKLSITKSPDGPSVLSTPCPNGSCFGMYLFAGLYAWTPLGPGTDGGLIIGKGQMSGGQEVNGLSANNGELTEMWVYGNNNNNGTFFTAPSDAGNVFDDVSCTGSGCGSNTTSRKTNLAVWNTAWGGQTVPMGSKNGCNPTVTPACTADQIAGIFVKSWTIDPAGMFPRKYRLTYSQVVPTVFTNYPFELVLSGTVACRPDECSTRFEISVNPSTLVGTYGVPIPFTISVTVPATCRVGTPPTNGAVILNGCTSGTYTSDVGFVGTNSFTLIANDGLSDSDPFTVNVAVIAPTPTPTTDPNVSPTPVPTPTPTYIASPTPTPTFCPVPDATIYLTTTTGQPVTWTGRYASSCFIWQSPTNGTATMTAGTDCSGVYTPNGGFAGRDKFIYGGRFNHCGVSVIFGTAYVDVCPVGTSCASQTPTPTYTSTYVITPTLTPTPTPTIIGDPMCHIKYPVSQVTLTGKQGHLSITVTGNLVSVNPNGKEIKICPTTTATYETRTTTPGATVVCQVKSNTSRGQGLVKVNDHIKCTDKPVGNDKLGIKIKSGVNQKAM